MLHECVFVPACCVQLASQHHQRVPSLLPGDADRHQRQQRQGHQKRGAHHVVHHGERKGGEKLRHINYI